MYGRLLKLTTKRLSGGGVLIDACTCSTSLTHARVGEGRGDQRSCG